MRSNGIKYFEALNCIILDRLIGITSLMLSVIMSSFFYGSALSSPELFNLLNYVSIFCFCSVSFIALLFGLVKRSRWVLQIIKINYLHRIVHSISLLSVVGVLKILVISSSVNLLSVLVFWFLFQAFSENVDILLLFTIVPCLYLLLSLPISFGGWGLREATLMFILSLENIAPEISFTVSLFYGLLLMLPSLLGLYFFLKLKKNEF